MNDFGFFVIDRGVWDHPLFVKETFSEREAWLWMLSAAVWADKRIRVGKSVIDLKRGQLAFATRFLAEKWKWAHSKVVRFLNRLKSDTMIVTEPTRDATLITICNYDKYQLARNASETQSGTPTETEVKRQRNKEEETKQINNQQIKEESPLRVDDWPSDYGDQFWQAYPRKTEKLAAMRKLATLRKSGIVTFADLMAGVHRYAASVSNSDPKYVKQPTTWLNAGCWADEIPQGGFNGNGTGNIRTNQATGFTPTRDTAVIAGMAGALDRRRAARAAAEADGAGVSGRVDPAGRDDADSGAAAGDAGAYGQLALIPAANTG